ncbi:MAG TPA: hypothetical protein VF926_15080 [Mycobacterium sp.]
MNANLGCNAANNRALGALKVAPGMAQLEFDEGLGKQLEAMYRRRDVIRRRLVMNALSAQPGEDVVDVGCGPGFYLTELAEQVGPQGSVALEDAVERSRGPRPCPPDWNTF